MINSVHGDHVMVFAITSRGEFNLVPAYISKNKRITVRGRTYGPDEWVT